MTRNPIKSQKNLETEAQVYSYIRFSSLQQKCGHSEKRQIEIKDTLAREFAKKVGLPFNESLNLADRGLSGYSGAHRKKGDLGRFLQMVDEGRIAKGSYLAVENLDRLSREEPILAIKTIIFGLIDHNINIVTFTPFETVYNRQSVNNNGIWQLIVHIQRAHEESKRKSELITKARNEARANARQSGKILTKRCPKWLTIKDDKFKAIPEAQETINKIFELKLDGFGKNRLVNKINQIATWLPTKDGWFQSYIQKILSNRAVIGEYQPYRRNAETGKREPIGEPIPNYFPKIVNQNTFYAVQNRLKENKYKGGKTGKASNLLQHLAKCAYCGGSMIFVNKGKPPKGANYLMCYNGRQGLHCSHHSIRYDECEKLILENCKGLRPEQVLPNQNEQTKLCLSLRQRIQGKTSEIKLLEEKINNYFDQIGNTKERSYRVKYESKMKELENQKAVIQKSIQTDEQELFKAENNIASFNQWKRDIIALQRALKKNDIDLRIRLRFRLKELIEKVEVYTEGFKELYEHSKDDHLYSGLIIAKKDLIAKIKTTDISYVILTESDGEISRILIKSPGYLDKTETFEDYLYDVIGENNPSLIRTKGFSNFIKHVIKRRMSKEGRFLRVFFKMGGWVDLVPKGSIATGSYMYINEDKKKSYNYVQPPIDKLWNEYMMHFKKIKLPNVVK